MIALMNSQRLRELRLQKNLSMQQVADALGVTRASVSKWEIGLNRPDVRRLEQLARLYEVTVGFLMGEGSSHSTVSYPVISAQEATKYSSTTDVHVESFPSTRRLAGPAFFVRVDNDVFVRAGLHEVLQGSMVLVDISRTPSSGDIVYVLNQSGQHIFALHNLVGGTPFFRPLSADYSELLTGQIQVVGVAVEAVTVTELTNVASRLKK